MKKYYIVVNNQSVGPYDIEELRMQGVTPQTPVWYDGLSDWTPAGQIPELSVLFAGYQQPGYQQVQYSDNIQVCPKTWLLESILVTLFCCMPFGIVGIVYASQVESKYNAGNFAGAMQASKNAGKWTKIGFICGIVYLVLWIIYIVGVVGLSSFAALGNM